LAFRFRPHSGHGRSYYRLDPVANDPLAEMHRSTYRN